MPQTLDRTDTALASALRIAVMRLARRLRTQRADNTALGMTQLSVLACLDRLGPLTIGELAASEKIQPPSVTRTVTCLEELGYVTRAAHPTDRRQVVVAETPAGAALLAEDRQRRDAWLAQRLFELTTHQRAVLREATTILEGLAQV